MANTRKDLSLLQPARPCRVHPLRALAAVVFPSAAYATLSVLLWWGGTGGLDAARAPAAAPQEQVGALLALFSAVAAWCALSWLAAGVIVSVLVDVMIDVIVRAGPPVRPPAVLARLRARLPQSSRRTAALLLGAGFLATAAAVPAHADSGLPGWSPDRPAATSSAAGASPAPAASPPPRRPVEVAPGDTLWGIASAHLGPGATVAAVAAEWPRWYAANRTLIGADPDVIRPGQTLRVPTPEQGRRPR